MTVVSTIAQDRPKPNLRWMLSHPAHVISLGFGVGLVPFAAGTWGALLGLFLARGLHPWVGDGYFFLGLALAFVLGIWAAAVTGRALGKEDHGAIVWDEVVAMALITAMFPGSLKAQAFLFLLFRLFDIAKPGPVGWADRQVKGGFGVMLDDLVAAALALFVAALFLRLWGY